MLESMYNSLLENGYGNLGTQAAHKILYGRRIKENQGGHYGLSPLFIKSIFVGVGAIAPGLSGALAMIFGIYERLVSAVSHLFTKLKENFVLLATVAAGVAVGVVFFAMRNDSS